MIEFLVRGLTFANVIALDKGGGGVLVNVHVLFGVLENVHWGRGVSYNDPSPPVVHYSVSHYDPPPIVHY